MFFFTGSFQQVVNLFDVGMSFCGFCAVSDSFSSLWLVSAYSAGKQHSVIFSRDTFGRRTAFINHLISRTVLFVEMSMKL